MENLTFDSHFLRLYWQYDSTAVKTSQFLNDRDESYKHIPNYLGFEYLNSLFFFL